MAPGVLYVVATPIGNLEDVTFRALRILKEVDLIAAEDTRRTAKLLAHYEIRKPVVSLREHNESREAPRLIAHLASGKSIALVSDAGTPAIADPGARLVRAVRDKGLPVVPIPGPSAVTAALSVAGLQEGAFTFLGFPPAAGSARRGFFEQIAQARNTVVLFEAPHRIERTVADLNQYVKRPIQVHNEISKIHEKYIESPNIARLPDRGEFTLVVLTPNGGDGGGDSAPPVAELIGRITECSALSAEEKAVSLSSLANISIASARKLLKKHQFSVKQRTQSST